ncbi:peptidylprolyl isomerase [Novosphingobium sp.]|uniref:peptidylprolyl isomerase n=1 Tax=Novosphingobium sp. TaxID=1874826 RepID=UPI0027358F84|nr:peptidylprolyl isomerase [Novosphingobium sp.]MDP3908534.1 peptidylprolyl isomerase [Novosphingobium sp.]
MRKNLLPIIAILTAAPALAADQPALPPAGLSPPEIVAAAPAADWVRIAPADLLVMELAPTAAGKARRVVIQLLPAPFSQGWTGNIRKLAAARFWDGTAVVRVQDNYVTQWGDPDAEDKAKARKLPEGLAVMPESEYVSGSDKEYAAETARFKKECPECTPVVKSPAKLRRERKSFIASELGKGDNYAKATGFTQGWPVAADADVGLWPVHCYGMVGAGRNMSPDTGTGAELYTVIGHAPRHLDRNIALVGRVIEGIEHLSSLPRGTGPLGFYETAEERTAITAVRLGTERADLPGYEYLSTESASFARYADARGNRRDAFFIRPAGGADICNIPVPVRRVP